MKLVVVMRIAKVVAITRSAGSRESDRAASGDQAVPISD